MPIIGQYIQRLTGLDQFSPPFPRGGQSVLVTVEVFSVPGGPIRLNVVLQHKNEEDTAWTDFANVPAIGATTGVKTAVASGCKEMLRFRYRVSLGASPHPYDTFYVNIPAPMWRP